MTVHLHWLDASFPAGFDEQHPNTRRAPYATPSEALEQAAHDLAFTGATIAGVFNEKSKDVLDRKKLVARAHDLIDAHHAPLANGLPDKEHAARLAAANADIEKRVA